MKIVVLYKVGSTNRELDWVSEKGHALKVKESVSSDGSNIKGYPKQFAHEAIDTCVWCIMIIF